MNILDEFTLDDPMEYASAEYEFAEGWKTIDALMELTRYHDIFDLTITEAVVDKKSSIIKSAKNIAHNTASTTKGIASIYTSITDAKGAALKNSIDLFLKVAGLIGKAVVFIFNQGAKIPNFALQVVDKATKIPGDVLNKIKGNIKLYITINDIKEIYQTGFIVKLDTFLSTAVAVSKGDMWSTMFNKRVKNPDGSKYKANQNDMALCRKLIMQYAALKSIEFTETVIDMNDDKNVNIYFGGKDNSIAFTDAKGVKHNDTYYALISQLIKDITDRKEQLTKIQEEFGKKYERTLINSSFADLGPGARNLVIEVQKDIGSVISIIGKMVRYTQTDLNTLNSTIDKIIIAGKTKHGLS